MSKELEPRAPGAPAPLDQVRRSVYSDLQYVSLQVEGKPYGGWYRLLPDGRMELLALANMHCERRPEETPIEQARGMLADFIRAAQADGKGQQTQDDEGRSRPFETIEPESTPQASTRSDSTLGNLLYADATKLRAPEHEWARMVAAIAAGDQVALDELFERTHRIVYTLMMRLVGKRDVAEALTLEVYHDVWRQAAQFDPAGGPVLSWLLNQARLRAIERLELERRDEGAASAGQQFSQLRHALASLSPSERELVEAAYFSRRTYRELAADQQQPADLVRRQIHAALESLRSQLGAEVERQG